MQALDAHMNPLSGATFATTNSPFPEPSTNGMQVANSEFYRSLLERRAFGRYIFYSSAAPGEDWVQILSGQLGLRRADKICFKPLSDLPRDLRGGEIQVLHRQDTHVDTYLNFRRLAPKAKFAVTGLTHTLSLRPDWQHHLQTLAMGATAGDALICTSTDAIKTMENIFSSLKKTFPALARQPALHLEHIPLAVPNGLARLDRVASKLNLGLEPDGFLLLYFGRLDSRTKADLVPLLIILSCLKLQYPGIRLILAGAVADKNEVGRLENVISGLGLEKSVVVLENPDASKKNRIFSAADIFISLPDNVQETFGLSLLEAMFHGLPIVCSDWAGYRDLVKAGENGFLVKTSMLDVPEEGFGIHPELPYVDAEQPLRCSVDLDEATQAIVELRENVELRNRLGENNLENVKRYTPPSMLEAYEALWFRLLEDGGECCDFEHSAFAMDEGEIFYHVASRHEEADPNHFGIDHERRALGEKLARSLGEPELLKVLFELGKGVMPKDIVGTRALAWLIKYGVLRKSS